MKNESKYPNRNLQPRKAIRPEAGTGSVDVAEQEEETEIADAKK